MKLRELLGFRSSENSQKEQVETPLNESVVSTIQPSNYNAEMMGVPEGNFIGDSFYDTGGVFGRHYNNAGLLEVERGYIMQQRSISIYPEVAIGIEEIMRDLFDKQGPLTLVSNIPSENSEDTKKVYEHFDDFVRKPFSVIGNPNTPQSLIMFNLLKQVYVDGHMVVLAAEIDEDGVTNFGDWKPTYGFNPPKSKMPYNSFLSESLDLSESLVHGYGINNRTINLNNMSRDDMDWLLEQQDVKLLEKKPQNAKDTKDSKNIEGETIIGEEPKKRLIFMPLDPTRLTMKGSKAFYDVRRGHQIQLDNTKLIQADFGLFDVMGARHGFLQYAFKYANQLQTLQDMLVPMRFRRSIARRIFNVDVGNLPQGRATEFMKDVQRKFKYKKSYDVKNGKITSKDDEQVGIVEDYWFANRSGTKGTTVEMMDEAGNFADSLEDISYFNKKLYQSMFIPLRRVFESEADYDYTSNTIEVDELRFHSFLNRVRFVYNSVFTRMFQMYLTNVGYDKEIAENVEVEIRYDNYFWDNKERERFESALGMFEDAKRWMGKYYSAETMMRMVFGMTPEEVQGEYNKIKSEVEEGSIFNPLYQLQAAEAESGDDEY